MKLSEKRVMASTMPPSCDASTYAKGYTIFSKGIALCGHETVAVFTGTRKDGKVTTYTRCADHVDETARVLDGNQGIWAWVRADLG